MHGSACVQQRRTACTNSDKPSLCWLLLSSYTSQADCERRLINKLICGDNKSTSPSQHLLSTRWKQQGTINPEHPTCKCKISQKDVNDAILLLCAHGPPRFSADWCKHAQFCDYIGSILKEDDNKYQFWHYLFTSCRSKPVKSAHSFNIIIFMFRWTISLRHN